MQIRTETSSPNRYTGCKKREEVIILEKSPRPKTGGMGKECLRYHSRRAELIAVKGELYGSANDPRSANDTRTANDPGKQMIPILDRK